MILNHVFVILDKHSQLLFYCRAPGPSLRLLCLCVDVFVAFSQSLYFCNKNVKTAFVVKTEAPFSTHSAPYWLVLDTWSAHASAAANPFNTSGKRKKSLDVTHPRLFVLLRTSEDAEQILEVTTELFQELQNSCPACDDAAEKLLVPGNRCDQGLVGTVKMRVSSASAEVYM